MADPITMAAIGGTIGAAMSPKDPLKGAMLGAVGGYGGGAMLGAGAGATSGLAAPAMSGVGLAPAATGLTAGSAGLAAPATFGGLGIAPATTGLAAGQASLAAPTAFSGVGLAPAGMAAANPFASFNQFAQQNPMLTNMGTEYLKNQMQPEPQMPMAQSQGLLRGTQMQPQGQQYQVGVPRISLI